MTADDLAARIPDGALLGLPPDYSLVAMEVVRALIRRKARHLKLLGVPPHRVSGPPPGGF
jgi:glutaconate CoA-transferase, subunit A